MAHFIHLQSAFGEVEQLPLKRCVSPCLFDHFYPVSCYVHHNETSKTVDGWNPAPPGMYKTLKHGINYRLCWLTQDSGINSMIWERLKKKESWANKRVDEHDFHVQRAIPMYSRISRIMQLRLYLWDAHFVSILKVYGTPPMSMLHIPPTRLCSLPYRVFVDIHPQVGVPWNSEALSRAKDGTDSRSCLVRFVVSISD